MMMKNLILLALAMSLAMSGYAQEDAVPARPEVKSFVYFPGKSSFEEINQYWEENQAKILGRGYLALGSGSGIDNISRAYDRDVELIDVAGVEFEGFTNARFMFYKGRLARIQIRLQTWLKKKEPEDLNLTEDEMNALERSLIKKYGKPQNSERSMFADRKKPDVLTWHLKENRLVFTSSLFNAGLILKNPALEKEIEGNRKNVCKEFNTNGRRICW